MYTAMMIAYVVMTVASSIDCDSPQFDPNVEVITAFDRMVVNHRTTKPSEIWDTLAPSVNNNREELLGSMMYTYCDGVLAGRYDDDIASACQYGISQVLKTMNAPSILKTSLRMLRKPEDPISYYAGEHLIDAYITRLGDKGLSVFDDYFHECRSSGSNSVQGLILYVYQRDLLAGLKYVAEHFDDNGRRKDLVDSIAVSISNEYEEARLARRGSTKEAPASYEAPDSKTVEMLLDFAQEDDGWTVLFLAELVRQVPNFRQKALLERLSASSNPYVQLSYSRTSTQKDSRVPSAWLFDCDLEGVRKAGK